MKKTILSAAAILLSCTVFAQTDTLRAVVNVSNEYNPVLIKVNKKSFTPSIGNSSNRQALQYEFTSEAIPYNGFVSERNGAELMQEQENPYCGYVRAGYGTANSLDTKLAYRRDLTARDNIKVAAAMDGYMTGRNGLFGKWDSRMYSSMAHLGYTHAFNGLKLGIEGDFGNRVFNYQKTGFVLNTTDKQNSMDYGVKVNGVSTLSGAFGYSFDAAFAHNGHKYTTGNDRSIYENSISAGGGTWYTIDHNEVKKIGVDVNVDAFLYNSIMRNAMHGYDNYVSVDIDPYIDFNLSGWSVRLGTRMNILTANGSAFAIAPAIKAEKYFANNISFYAKATGGREDNGLSKLESIAPYWNYDEERSLQLKPTYRVLDAEIGSTVTFEPLSMGISAGYAYTKDDLLQYCNCGDRYYVYDYVYTGLAQDDTHNAHAELFVGYDLGGWLKIAGDARYDYWKCDSKELLLMKPEITCNVNAEVKPLKGLTLNAGYNFTYFTKGANDKRAENKNELNLRACYDIFPWLGVYIQGSNLIGSKHFEYAGYEALGARGLLGVTANF